MLETLIQAKYQRERNALLESASIARRGRVQKLRTTSLIVEPTSQVPEQPHEMRVKASAMHQSEPASRLEMTGDDCRSGPNRGPGFPQ